MSDILDCSVVDERDLVSLYVGDKLSSDDAEAFEAHYFSCQRCWPLVQQAVQIRAALEMGARPARTAGRTPWPWLAAAAAVILVAAVWQMVPRSSVSPTPPTMQPAEIVLRSPGGGALALRATASADHSIQLQWPAESKAVRYTIKVFAADGSPVVSRETITGPVTLVPVEFKDVDPTATLYARLEATDAMGVVIASSERVKLPNRN